MILSNIEYHSINPELTIQNNGLKLQGGDSKWMLENLLIRRWF